MGTDASRTHVAKHPERLYFDEPLMPEALPPQTAQLPDGLDRHRLFGPLPVADGGDLYTQGRQSTGGLAALPSPGIMPSGMVTAAGPNAADPDHLANFVTSTDPGQRFKTHLAREAANVTPGVDDTPYILYALDALTGDVTMSTADALDPSNNRNTSTSNYHNSFPYQYIPDEGLGYYRPRSFSRPDVAIGTASIKIPTVPSPVMANSFDDFDRFDRRYSSSGRGAVLPRRDQPPSPRTSTNPQEPRTSTTSSLSTLVHTGPLPPRTSQPSSQLPANHLKDSWIYLDLKTYAPQAGLVFPPPTFKPAILRSASMAVLVALCLLMTAALVFCAVYSSKHSSLVVFSGSIYDGQFFLFRVVPQLVSACILLYAQSMTTAVVRIFPFSRMEGFEHAYPEDRNGAIFDDIYPRSFLWPQISRSMPWCIQAPLVLIWLMNITVPLQSALFSVVFVDGNWRWAATQGVAWTLVALYLIFAAAVGAIWVYWYNRSTGLIWDPRSLADWIVLASNSNTMVEYHGTELMPTREDLRQKLRHRAIDKIGYWTWRDGRSSGLWHGIGTDMLDEAWFDRQGMFRDDMPPATADWEESALSPHSEDVRYRYLPWCLRGTPLVCVILTAFVLLLVLFVVSFTPSTEIRSGFRPRVEAAAAAGAFSPANFLYSFLPALLGQILFLLFLGWDMALRTLQPWAELAKHAGGAQPEASILADYAACLPLQSTWHAVRNRHWRVAAVSLMGTVFAFLPALAGGLFMALTVSSGSVRMVPNMALYAVVLSLLVLYLVCLVCMLPDRREFRLPHAVTCTAEILSFCANDDLMCEPAFKNVHDRKSLLDQLGINSRPTDRSRWIFANGTSGDHRRLGIHRVRRYTELTNRPSARRQPQTVAR